MKNKKTVRILITSGGALALAAAAFFGIRAYNKARKGKKQQEESEPDKSASDKHPDELNPSNRGRLIYAKVDNPYIILPSGGADTSKMKGDFLGVAKVFSAPLPVMARGVPKIRSGATSYTPPQPPQAGGRVGAEKISTDYNGKQVYVLTDGRKVYVEQAMTDVQKAALESTEFAGAREGNFSGINGSLQDFILSQGKEINLFFAR